MLEVRTPPLPSWWRLDLAPPVELPAEPEDAAREEPQLVLDLGRAKEPEPGPEPDAVALERLEPLAASEIFKEQAESKALREQVLKAVAYLLARHGVADVRAFANAMGEPEFRASGLVSRLSQVLNYDQYQVLRYDSKSRQVHLDTDLLKELFDL